MKKLINNVHVEGWVYQHKLEMKTSKSGVNYIRGDIEIATDNALLNIVKVNVRYVAPTYDKEGKKVNPAFEDLRKLIDGTYKTVMGHGADVATTVKVDGSLSLNEFYSDRNGSTELVAAKINDVSFIHFNQGVNTDENKRNTFEADMIINNVFEREANEEKGTPEKAVISGYIFNTYSKMALPYEFEATNKAAMDYFIGLEASQTHPVFTKLSGHHISNTVKKQIIREGAFGDVVTEVDNHIRSLDVDWAAKEPYLFGEEDTMTEEELKKAIADHEVNVATIKSNYDTYQSSKGSAFTPASTPVGGFDF